MAAASPWPRCPTRIAAIFALAAEIGVDFLAVSFVKTAADIEQARALLRAAGGDAALVAKIERAEAIANWPKSSKPPKS